MILRQNNWKIKINLHTNNNKEINYTFFIILYNFIYKFNGNE